MPCRQASTFNGTAASSGSYATEAECNQACKDGACCEGTSCTVKPQCQCQGTGKTFKGVGTVCADVSCGCCGNGESIAGKSATLYVSTDSIPTAKWCPRTVGGTAWVLCPDNVQYSGCWPVKPCEMPVAGVWVDTSFSASATFTGNAAASGCSASLQGQCFGETRSAYVGVVASPCKIYATVECTGLMSVRINNYFLSPYWAWTYDQQATEYNALYYVFQYLTGMGGSTATQSVTSTPVPPTDTSSSWYLFKTVIVNMRLTLA